MYRLSKLAYINDRRPSNPLEKAWMNTPAGAAL
jgi:hypothetical protein